MEWFSSGSLISSENNIAVMAAMFAIALFGFAMEKTRVGALLTGTVWTILGAILLSNIRIIPFDSGAYDFVFSYFVPVLIPLFLIKANLRRIFFETTRMAGAFTIATVATVLGALAAAVIFDLGELEAAITGSLTASYIGGSVNFGPLIEETGLAANEPSLVSAIVAADHLASATYLGILAVLPGIAWIAKRFVERDHTGGEIEETGEGSSGRATMLSIAMTLTFALSVVAVAEVINGWFESVTGISGLKYVFVTGLAVLPATFLPKQMDKLHGGFEIGVVLAFVYFGAIAAGANVPDMISQAPMIVAFIAVLVLIHAVVMLIVGSLFKLSLPEMIIASNAAILGATTAPALAAAKGWKDLVTPGVLAGILGYVLGTSIALVIYTFLGGQL